MALTEQEIQFNYTQTMLKANELSSLSGDIDSAVTGMMATAMMLKNCWQGSNSDEFIRKCNLEKQKMMDTKKKLEKLVVAMKNIAEEVRQAELNALAIAREKERLANMAKMAASSAGRTTGTIASSSNSSQRQALSHVAPAAATSGASSGASSSHASKAKAASPRAQSKATKTSTSIN